LAVDMAHERREEKRRREDVINNVINTLTIRLIRTFSVAPDKLPIYSKFGEIAKREAGSRGFSEVLLKAMAEYNQRHEEGNPQLKIASYLPAAATGPLRVICWRFLKGAMKDGQVLCNISGTGHWINGVKCYSCRHNQCRKKVTTSNQEP
jgi:hypothetical protein